MYRSLHTAVPHPPTAWQSVNRELLSGWDAGTQLWWVYQPAYAYGRTQIDAGGPYFPEAGDRLVLKATAEGAEHPSVCVVALLETPARQPLRLLLTTPQRVV